MQWSAWIGLALGFLAASTDFGPPPVILDLGPVTPTPVPTPEAANRKRLISTITVQNAANGESVISFEATDVADKGNEKIPLIAAKSYSLTDIEDTNDPQTQKVAREVARRIVVQVRELEREMLHFAEIIGPPKEREPIIK